MPFSTLHYREDQAYWAQWFPADFITESFPGQFRNWFYSMLAMSTVLRSAAPFKTILGYATLFGDTQLRQLSIALVAIALTIVSLTALLGVFVNKLAPVW